MAEQGTNDDLQVLFHTWAQEMTTRTSREVAAPMNPNVGTTTTWMREFTRKNSSEFHGSKFKKDPEEFIDEFYKTLGITSVEKTEMSAYQLKGVSKVCFNQ